MRHVRVFLLKNGRRVFVVQSKNKKYYFDEDCEVFNGSLKDSKRIDNFVLGKIYLNGKILAVVKVIDRVVYWARIDKDLHEGDVGICAYELHRHCTSAETSEIFEDPKEIVKAAKRWQDNFYPNWENNLST